MSKARIAIILLVLLSACSTVENPIAGVATGMLQTRDYIVTLYTGSQGSFYSVHNLDGTLLEEDINMETMVARFPELSHLMDNNRVEWADVDSYLLNLHRR